MAASFPRGAIGNTPLIKVESLSRLTGCTILAKCEHLSACGSVKDRPAHRMLSRALERGDVSPSGVGCVEATGGNTGIGLAMACAAAGVRCSVFAPANVSTEKLSVMRALGADVTVCDASAKFGEPGHYFFRAEAFARETGSFFCNQFENPDNADAHRESTGPEIWEQCPGDDGPDAFVCASGTGGTIAGVSEFLRSREARTAVFLADPPGSAMRSFVLTGEVVASEGSTIAEGIGNGRVTGNFARAKIDGVVGCTDAEIVAMSKLLLAQDGLFIGPSAALNLVAAVRVARGLSKEKGTTSEHNLTVVTILCDGGDRYMSKVHSDAWIREQGISCDPCSDLSFIVADEALDLERVNQN